MTDIFQDGFEVQPESTFERILLREMVEGNIVCDGNNPVPSSFRFRIKVVEYELIEPVVQMVERVGDEDGETTDSDKE